MRRRAVLGVRHDQLALELGEYGQYPENGPPLHGGGVDALLDDVQPDAALAQFSAEGHQMQHGAGEPVEPGDLQCVALAQQSEDEIELRAGRLRAARGVDVDVLAVGTGPK
ncbi:hypothetical protein GCM10023237_69270 [Streptomyces coeruleoprunus]